MDKAIIEFENVDFSYNGSPVLTGVSFKVSAGEYLAVMGPNGGGKSTLLKLMLGIVRPERGRITVLGGPPGATGGRIGYLPQASGFSGAFPITVLEAVKLGMVKPGFVGISGFSGGRAQEEKARAMLKRVGMEGFEQRPLPNLSGGQRQRVFIARALVSDPELLLLDEPTAGVDAPSQIMLFELLAELNKRITIVMVSHDISAVARGVKSIACVNRSLHFHAAPEMTEEMFRSSFGYDEACPVELVTHGNIPHRVLEHHEGEGEK